MTEEQPPTKKPKMSAGNLQSMIYTNEGGTTPKLQVLDQLLIPHEKVYIDVPDVAMAYTVIKTMQIRGAPLIAIVALLGLSVDMHTNAKSVEELDKVASDADGLLAWIREKMAYLKSSRPTAVNLTNALVELEKEMKEALETNSAEDDKKKVLCKAVLDYSEFMLDRDVKDNKAIGKFGAESILKKTGKDKINLVTICNTGSLATAGYGTALGVARSLQEMGKLETISALETRPYNQGSRLTAFEIMEEKMPGGQLICDSSAGALMQTKQVDACVVGADRVCANGDTANKIGTYNLSIIAAFHKIPFYVAAPITSLDITLESGKSIPIEERSSEELISTSKAPAGMPCWNPAFDVTPDCNITGIITEKGVIEPDTDGKFDVKAFVEKHTSA
uniref:Methylthioribose-1-phosphate isomerase n=2 Tax=Pseudo-nitzschia australis TaxID=44445 RepID=A0A7S4AAY6_9STRA|mmetsp:Transcript_27904/g.61463  ORF Transcript_27904/g.61463 Transcript_27904/m.61463 type:complete len:391 (-) Transcript_27904:1182-2354(-)|eukprot:CAMPEP_0168219042 /NCGR_PEP_ID=MMETSP0140_2-20121125/8295_1 /TAXON_ID=44445 /ORGANISM="Pseudo-nitzschia australis, Strain 10249 10 AB" /LENGTH=390 /DNA_ID=CAMNT_0008147289 /DNA_START=8 /DNA_END=1180 /DNA_ORIENTATION=-